MDTDKPTSTEIFEPVARWPADERPRERLLTDGAGVLSDAELLAVLLRTGRRNKTVVDLARQVLQSAGGLYGAAHLHQQEWQEIPGIGPSKAATVQAALELGRRTWSGRPPDPDLGTPEAVYAYVAPRFLGGVREELWVLGLNAKNLVTVDELVGAGTADRAPAHAREVFGPLLRGRAVKGVLCHNHPSGDPEPSTADRRLTRQLVQAGALLELPLVDHVIVGREGYVSMQERGLMPSG